MKNGSQLCYISTVSLRLVNFDGVPQPHHSHRPLHLMTPRRPTTHSTPCALFSGQLHGCEFREPPPSYTSHRELYKHSITFNEVTSACCPGCQAFWWQKGFLHCLLKSCRCGAEVGLYAFRGKKNINAQPSTASLQSLPPFFLLSRGGAPQCLGTLL